MFWHTVLPFTLISPYNKSIKHKTIMRLILILLLGLLIYKSNDARYVISDYLIDAAKIVRPNPQIQVRY